MMVTVYNVFIRFSMVQIYEIIVSYHVRRPYHFPGSNNLVIIP